MPTVTWLEWRLRNPANLSRPTGAGTSNAPAPSRLATILVGDLKHDARGRHEICSVVSQR
jgi:hypothetical protein